MQKCLIVTTLFAVSASIVPEASVKAVSYSNFPQYPQTSRSIERSAQYRRSLELRERRLQALQRTRSQKLSRQSKYLRISAPLPTASRSGLKTRRNVVKTPVLRTTRLSVYSRIPVRSNTEALYRNGVRFFRGNDVKRSYASAWMWFSLALAEGHPLARSALHLTEGRMTQSQRTEAERRTAAITVALLEDATGRGGSIRDRVRRQDLEQLYELLFAFADNHDGMFPAIIPETETEICRERGFACGGMVDLHTLVPNYTLRIPTDPLVDPEHRGTGYYIFMDEEGYLVLFSPYGERDVIVVTE